MKTALFKIPAAAKTSFCLITAAGTLTLTIDSLNLDSLSSLNSSSPLVSSPFSHRVRTALHGVVRSSRALSTITSSVVDYKYSLRGFSKDTDEYRQTLSEVHLRSAQRFLKLCEANKGFYVKAGQYVAALQQVPREYSSTLATLQDQAIPCPFEDIKEVLTFNFGSDLSGIFLDFDERPIAAASIAQVHYAVLKDHQEVAVKVQYPGLEDQMKIDIGSMSFLSKIVAWLFPEYRFQWMVSEFTAIIATELDFIQEARNSERTAKNFKNNSKVRIPHVLWELTKSQVLTMQFCRGRKVDDVEYIMERKINSKKVAKALLETFAEMIFVHGFVHGDPHPGNILVSPEGKDGFSLVLLDHGIYKTLDEEFRVKYCQLWKALILLDSKNIQQLGEYFGVGRYSRFFPLIFTGRTIDSKLALGKGMTAEEKRNVKQDVKSLTMGDISAFMESLPSEFLTVLRIDGLLRVTATKLGSLQRDRLLIYAKYALRGLSSDFNLDSDSLPGVVFTSFKSSISFLQLKLLLELLELLSWVEGTRQSFIAMLKKALIYSQQLLSQIFPLLSMNQ